MILGSRYQFPNIQHDLPLLDPGRKLWRLLFARVILVAPTMLAQNCAFA
jgi:hypothetical protein